MDRALKKHYYESAGIPWYLVVDHIALTIDLFELVGTTYEKRSMTHGGEILHLTEPVLVDLDLAALLPD
ncbi:Uma2 family endonuclease [Paractinoplanes lichenicola]|uniref:Uma2 family endonuclease n=1 Tax=Paractinoplanes lichenicola TaxID=2802976 RepID=A0ABS1VJS6_9ACTN|nr:Uma2 family endonuclease [Actinoplanes lichenicola]MBL7254914.1 Uma2 family endonuclease [Actinoplanes lichenicola]